MSQKYIKIIAVIAAVIVVLGTIIPLFSMILQ